jgi:hypothetical protein
LVALVWETMSWAIDALVAGGAMVCVAGGKQEHGCFVGAKQQCLSNYILPHLVFSFRGRSLLHVQIF